MNVSAVFIQRPVATTLLTIGITLVGVIAFQFLPVAALPQIEFPTISVSASLPGASPETMASSVAAPLERQFARIAGVTEMTSSSTLGSSSVVLQFELSRNIDGAARDVQAAISAARADLPAALPINPTYRKVNPADAPIIILALMSEIVGRGQMYDAASSILQQKLSQVEGVGQVTVGGGSLPAVRVDLNPTALNKYNIGLGDVRRMLAETNVNRPKGQLTNDTRTWEIHTNDQLQTADAYMPLIVAYRDGRAVRLEDVAKVDQFGRGHPHDRAGEWETGRPRHHLPAARGQYHRDGGPCSRPPSPIGGVHSRRPFPSRSSWIARRSFARPCMMSNGRSPSRSSS